MRILAAQARAKCASRSWDRSSSSTSSSSTASSSSSSISTLSSPLIIIIIIIISITITIIIIVINITIIINIIISTTITINIKMHDLFTTPTLFGVSCRDNIFLSITLLPFCWMLTSQCLEDDAAEVARERVALLELSQAGVNLMEFTRIMAEQLPQDQEGLDLVEESVAQAKETTRQAAPSLNLQKISTELGAKGCV